MATNESPDREERIEMEIVVDAYGAEKRAMGWYYYLLGVGGGLRPFASVADGRLLNV